MGLESWDEGMLGPREVHPGLSVFGETVDCDAVSSRPGWQWSDIDLEKRSIEDGALRYAEAYVCCVRHHAADRHGLG